MRAAWILLLVGTVGCEGGLADAALDTSVLGDGVWFELQPATGPDGVPGGAGHYIVSCDPNAYPVPEQIRATGGAGRIDVNHVGVWAACSTEWEISGVLREDVVEMTYAQSNAIEDDCFCPGELSYTILNVSSGEWTLRAWGQETRVVVDAP